MHIIKFSVSTRKIIRKIRIPARGPRKSCTRTVAAVAVSSFLTQTSHLTFWRTFLNVITSRSFVATLCTIAGVVSFGSFRAYASIFALRHTDGFCFTYGSIEPSTLAIACEIGTFLLTNATVQTWRWLAFIFEAVATKTCQWIQVTAEKGGISVPVICVRAL